MDRGVVRTPQRIREGLQLRPGCRDTREGKGCFPRSLWGSPRSLLSTTTLSPPPVSLLRQVRRLLPHCGHRRAPCHCCSSGCLDAAPVLRLQTLMVAGRLFCPKEFSLSSNFLERESGVSPCVLFPLWDFFAGNNNNTKILPT